MSIRTWLDNFVHIQNGIFDEPSRIGPFMWYRAHGSNIFMFALQLFPKTTAEPETRARLNAAEQRLKDVDEIARDLLDSTPNTGDYILVRGRASVICSAIKAYFEGDDRNEE